MAEVDDEGEAFYSAPEIDHILQSTKLEGWYFEGHYCITEEPEDPTIEFPEGHKIALIYFFTDAKNIAEHYPDGDAFLGVDTIDDTTRFEINTSKYELKVTKGVLSEERRMYIQEELDKVRKEYGIY